MYYVGHKEERARKFATEVASLQFNVLCTTYEYIMRDRTKLAKVLGHLMALGSVAACSCTAGRGSALPAKEKQRQAQDEAFGDRQQPYEGLCAGRLQVLPSVWPSCPCRGSRVNM